VPARKGKKKPASAEIDPSFRPVVDAFAHHRGHQRQTDVFLRPEGERETFRYVRTKAICCEAPPKNRVAMNWWTRGLESAPPLAIAG